MLKIYLLLSKHISNLWASKTRRSVPTKGVGKTFGVRSKSRNEIYLSSFYLFLFCRLRLVPAGSLFPLDSFGGGLRKQTLSRTFLVPKFAMFEFSEKNGFLGVKMAQCRNTVTYDGHSLDGSVFLRPEGGHVLVVGLVKCGTMYPTS